MILDKIVSDKQAVIESAKALRPIDMLIEEIRLNGKTERRSLIDSILARVGRGQAAIIAEIKRRSPSGGDMNHGFDLVELAQIYEGSGAVGISVLTDEKYFGGSPEDLLKVKQATGLPVLRKDFIVDEYQVYEAALYGADAILLIAAILTDDDISKLMQVAEKLGLEVLLESHSQDELLRSIKSGAKLLGINNRNLDTLVTDLNTSINLLQLIPEDRIVISESGIKTRVDMERLLDAGADGFLIGESLLKSGDPGQKLAELTG